MIRKCIGNGLTTARSLWGLALLLWGGNIVIAAGVAWAVAWLFESAAGSSLAVDVLTDGYNYTVMRDLRLEGFHYGRTAIATLLIAAPLALLVNTLLMGGVLATLFEKARVSLWHLIASSVAYAGRFIRLVLLGVGALLLTATGLALLVWVNTSSAATDRELAELLGGALVIQLFIGGLVWTALDYARIWIVRDRMGSAWQAFGRGMRMLLLHPLATMTMQLAAVVAAAFTVLLQTLVGTPMGIERLGGIVAIVLLHQTLVFARSYVRLALLCSQVTLTEFFFPSGIGQRTE